MVRILLSGCNGHMGRVIAASVKQRCDCEIVAGFDINADPCEFPVYTRPENCNIEADVLVDFSHPSALDGVLRYALEHSIPVVLATTGLSDAQKAQVNDAAKHIPVFSSANMSIGVSLLTELARKAAAVLGNDFDIEIVEKHHNQKVDAPSGTALMLGDAVSEGLSFEPEYVFDRHSVRRKRDKKEIGFSAIRGGTIVGEHDIIFAGHDEVITLSHAAHSKEIFAVGGVNAAVFLVGKPAGMYTMRDLVASV